MKIARRTQGKAVLKHLKICITNTEMLLKALIEMTEDETPHEKDDLETFMRIHVNFYMNLKKWLKENPPRIEKEVLSPWMKKTKILDQIELLIGRINGTRR